jgi:hypothetical protein
MGYLRRLWPSALRNALVFGGIVAIRFLIDLVAGRAQGGSAANIAERIIAIAAVIAVCAFVPAAILDWYQGYLERKRRV